MPALLPVRSSNLSAVGYDGANLFVRFHSGGIYRYSQVPSSLYEGLLRASSHGTYFDRYIKKGGYRYSRVG